jgi:ribosomal protein S27AE
MTEIKGHPTVELDLGNGQPTLITVCANCGELRTILMLTKDRWYCTRCRIEGATVPNLFPIS